MGKIWAGKFKFLEALSMPDLFTDCAALSADDVEDYPPATVSYLEVRISSALVIQ